MLFIDDASMDETVAIVSESDLPRVRLMRNERNYGLFGTLNRALNAVETDYVSLVFPDDTVETTYLQEMRRLVERHPYVSFLWAGYTNIGDLGETIWIGRDSGREEIIPPGVQPWNAALRRGCYWTISGSVSKTARLRHHGFRADLPQCGDYEFLLRAIRQDTFLYYERLLTRLRIHPAQASHRYWWRSTDLREYLLLYREQKLRFKADFDTTLQTHFARKFAVKVARRSLQQASRGLFREALGTAALFPKMLQSVFGSGGGMAKPPPVRRRG